MKSKPCFFYFIIFWVALGFANEITSMNRSLLKILYDNSDWNIIESTSDSIYISEKIIADYKLNAIKVEKLYDINPVNFTNVIMDVKRYDSFLSNANSLYTRVIENRSDGLLAFQRIVIDLPFFDDREYYFYMSRKPFDNHSSNIMCYWILLEPGQSPTTNDLTENATYLKNGAGLWKWEPAQSGRIRISYILTMNPGGSIPYFLVGMINKNSIVGLFRDVQNEVMSKNYFES